VPGHPPGVRLLPNAVTVLALCAGLSGVYFALEGRFELCAASIAAAAVFDALDGGLARLLDASSRIGAELDSLSDLVAFGVAPALVFYVWELQGTRFGWTVALVFAVCMALRLARFNTLIGEPDKYPFAKEFFVGVPAPAAALVGGLPLILWLQFGPGWWSAPVVVGLWALFAAALMVSRLPTVSLKTVRVPSELVPTVLVLVGLGAAGLITAPFLLMAALAVGYLLLMPFTLYRYYLLTRHPEAWGVPVRERRAVARAARSARRLGLRSPLRHRVAGRASAVARRVRGLPGTDAADGSAARARGERWRDRDGRPAVGRRSRLRLGLRRARRR
jgi:CDP-diacylglycerol---serine O-phosphatidyltransferase